jgi:hypothetical protein
MTRIRILISPRLSRTLLSNAEVLEVLEKKKKMGYDEFKKACYSKSNIDLSEKVKFIHQ